MREKKKKSNLVVLVALVLESELRPVLLEDSYLSHVRLSPRNIHIQWFNQDFSEVRTILQIALPLPHPRPENNDNNNNNLP